MIHIDLLLIVPPSPNSDSDGRRIEAAPRLGLGYLGAYAERAGHSVTIVNAPKAGLSREQVVAHVMELNPLVVGITMSYQHVDLLSGVELTRALRRAGFTGHITTGGYTATFEWAQLLPRLPELNTLVIGEGEITLEALIRAIKAGDDIATIPGLAYMADGEPRMTAQRPLIEDLDILPFPLRDADEITSDLPISSSRGCYARCSFCSIHTFYDFGRGKRWRARSPLNIIAEIEEMQSRYGISSFYFVDDNFIGPGKRGRERASAFAEEVIARRLSLTFGISCRANDVEPLLFAKLKAAGLRTVFLGIESGVQRQLDTYQKHVTVEQNKAAIRTLRELGLRLSTGFIPFDPDTTLEEVEENIRFLRDTNIYRSDSGLYNLLVHVYPFPGTPINQRLTQEGRLISDAVGDGITQILRYSFADSRVAALHSALLPLYFSLLQSFDIVLDLIAAAEENGLVEEGARFRRWMDNLGLFGLNLMDKALQYARSDSGLSDPAATAELRDYACKYSARFFSEEILRKHPVLSFAPLAPEQNSHQRA